MIYCILPVWAVYGFGTGGLGFGIGYMAFGDLDWSGSRSLFSASTRLWLFGCREPPFQLSQAGA